MRGGRLSPLPASALRTSESESSSSRNLPTPSARDFKGGNPNRQGGDDLPTAILKLLPTPEAKSSTAGPDYARATRPGSGGDDLVTTMAKIVKGMIDGSEYEPAIRRWEEITRPAPVAIEEGETGNARLAAQFSEWMMGYEDGWITDLIAEGRGRKPEGFISRTEAMRQIGNSVCNQQAEQALTDLLSA
ncbi:DNA methylase [Mycobacterium phage Vanisoa]|nr:DNA methylase [Mycobacterium phage Vanisoa]